MKYFLLFDALGIFKCSRSDYNQLKNQSITFYRRNCFLRVWWCAQVTEEPTQSGFWELRTKEEPSGCESLGQRRRGFPHQKLRGSCRNPNSTLRNPDPPHSSPQQGLLCSFPDSSCRKRGNAMIRRRRIRQGRRKSGQRYSS